MQFRSEWSKPCTEGSMSYLPFNGFCTPNLEAKDESSADLIRIVIQALFAPPWRHSQGENWLSKLCKSRSAASMGGTEGARITLLLLYTYTCWGGRGREYINGPEFLPLQEHDRFSQAFCYFKFLTVVLLLLLLHNTKSARRLSPTLKPVLRP